MYTLEKKQYISLMFTMYSNASMKSPPPPPFPWSRAWLCEVYFFWEGRGSSYLYTTINARVCRANWLQYAYDGFHEKQ